MVMCESEGCVMRKIIAWVLIVGIGAVLTMGWPIVAVAAELQTTWRAGDTLSYNAACRSSELSTYLVEDWSYEAWYLALASGRCIDMALLGLPPVPASLVKWVSGPYTSTKDGSGPRDTSLWEVMDITGETVYILLGDKGGPHGAVINWHI